MMSTYLGIEDAKHTLPEAMDFEASVGVLAERMRSKG